jgi:hypothetical protein
MTTEIRQAIDLHLRQGKYPKPNTLSEYLIGKGIPCSPAEALAHMKEYQEQGMLQGNPELVELLRKKKTTPENLVERVVEKPAFDSKAFSSLPIHKPTTAVEAPKPIKESKTKTEKPKMTPKQIFDFIVDSLSVAVAVVVDIIMGTIGWGILAYDDLTRVAFVALGFVLVLFSLRSWLKAIASPKGSIERRISFGLWTSLLLIVWFMDTSVSIASSHAQSQIVVYDASKDEVLNALKKKEKDDASYLEALRSKQVELGSGYKSQIDSATEQANQSAEAVVSYVPKQVAGQRTAISSSSIFTAIPDAARSQDLARIIGLILWSTLWASIQLLIVVGATNVAKKVEV